MHRAGKYRYCPAVALTLLLMLGGCGGKEPDGMVLQEAQIEEEQTEDKQKEEQTEDKAADTGKIYIHVCGEVQHPGVYELTPDSRIFEAVEAAGGVLSTAAADALNQAEKLQDGQRVYVPSQEELQNSQPGQADSTGMEPVVSETDGRVDINRAGMEELMTLSGIGQAKAEAIIRYRESNGNFQSVEELKNVAGIKEGTYEKLKEQIRV